MRVVPFYQGSDTWPGCGLLDQRRSSPQPRSVRLRLHASAWGRRWRSGHQATASCDAATRRPDHRRHRRRPCRLDRQIWLRHARPHRARPYRRHPQQRRQTHTTGDVTKPRSRVPPRRWTTALAAKRGQRSTHHHVPRNRPPTPRTDTR